MVLQLSLSPQLEDRLRQEAQRRGVSLDAVTIELLNEHLPHGNLVAATEVRCHGALLSRQDEGRDDDLGRLVHEARSQSAATLAAWQALRERLAIEGQAIGAKQFRQKLVAGGMDPNGSAFSRELIAMREE